MAVDRRFVLLCAGEILVVAVGDLLAALVLQVVALAAFLDDRRGYPVFAGVLVIFAAILSVSGRIFIPLLGVAGVLGCGYLALSLQDYRIARWARGEG